MPLTVAFAKSINTIPVIMSIKIGQATGVSHVANAAKIGRAKIIQTARAMGLTTPLTDTVSLPIGAAEVTVIDQTAGYAVFANGGKRATALCGRRGAQLRRRGDLPPRPARSRPTQVLSTRVVADMNYMLTKVVEEGTGKRATLDGVKAGRQDRHHQRLSRRLVRRLHRQPRRRGVVRQRRPYLDRQDDRRLACRRCSGARSWPTPTRTSS